LLPIACSKSIRCAVFFPTWFCIASCISLFLFLHCFILLHNLSCHFIQQIFPLWNLCSVFPMTVCYLADFNCSHKHDSLPISVLTWRSIPCSISTSVISNLFSTNSFNALFFFIACLRSCDLFHYCLCWLCANAFTWPAFPNNNPLCARLNSCYEV
jgi:hypothetical protein